MSLKPVFDELTLFLMSSAFFLLFLINPDMQNNLLAMFKAEEDFKGVFLWFSIGLLLSVYHIFSKRKKHLIEKEIMLFFAIVVNVYSGVSAGYYVYNQAKGWLILFPVLNIINVAMLLLLFLFKAINAGNVKDDNVSLKQTLTGLISLIALLVFCQYVLKYYWAITFSICVVYANITNDIIHRVFIKKRS